MYCNFFTALQTRVGVSVTSWYYFEEQGCCKVAEIQEARNSTKQLCIEEQKKGQGCLCHSNDFAWIGVQSNILKSYMGVKDYQIFINKLKNKIYAEKSLPCSWDLQCFLSLQSFFEDLRDAKGGRWLLLCSVSLVTSLFCCMDPPPFSDPSKQSAFCRVFQWYRKIQRKSIREKIGWYCEKRLLFDIAYFC